MARTVLQNRALAWYCKEHDVIPQLFTHPVYYFRDRQGNETSALLEHIVQNYQRSKKTKAKTLS